jgi:hypothetical protein
MDTTGVLALIFCLLIVFTASFMLGYKEGKEDGLATSLKWRKNLEKAAR